MPEAYSDFNFKFNRDHSGCPSDARRRHGLPGRAGEPVREERELLQW